DGPRRVGGLTGADGRNRGGYRGQVPATFLDGFQGLGAKGERRRIRLVELEAARVQVPAVIVEPDRRVGRKLSHVLETFLFQVDETDHNVRHLHAGVVNVVLRFDAAPSEAQQADKGVAQDGIAQVADM